MEIRFEFAGAFGVEALSADDARLLLCAGQCGGRNAQNLLVSVYEGGAFLASRSEWQALSNAEQIAFERLLGIADGSATFWKFSALASAEHHKHMALELLHDVQVLMHQGDYETAAMKSDASTWHLKEASKAMRQAKRFEQA